MDDEMKKLQSRFRGLEAGAAEAMSGLHDPGLDMPTEDGRSIRKVIYDLSDHYREHIEQLLWTKWGQRVPRSENRRALAELQGLRAQFAAYFTDLTGEQLDASSDAGDGASPREVIAHVMGEEDEAIEAIHRAMVHQHDNQQVEGRNG